MPDIVEAAKQFRSDLNADWIEQACRIAKEAAPDMIVAVSLALFLSILAPLLERNAIQLEPQPELNTKWTYCHGGLLQVSDGGTEDMHFGFRTDRPYPSDWFEITQECVKRLDEWRATKCPTSQA